MLTRGSAHCSVCHHFHFLFSLKGCDDCWFSCEPPPGQDPPQGHAPTTSPTSSGLSPEDSELTQRLWQTPRNPSPPKKARTEPGWEELLDSISAKDIEISCLDYALQQELRSSPQARDTPEALHFDPEQGNLQKIDLSKTRPFTDTRTTRPQLSLIINCWFRLASKFAPIQSSSSTTPKSRLTQWIADWRLWHFILTCWKVHSLSFRTERAVCT